MSANSNIYPWTDDPNLGIQLSDYSMSQTITEGTNDIGFAADPSFFMGHSIKPSAENLLYWECHGTSWTKSGDKYILNVYNTPAGMVNSDGTAYSRYGLCPDSAIYTAGWNMRQFDNTSFQWAGGTLRSIRNLFNDNRWYNNNAVIGNANFINYGYRPVVKCLRGQICTYVTLRVAPNIFENELLNYSAYATWWEHSSKIIPLDDFINNADDVRNTHPIILNAYLYIYGTQAKGSNLRGTTYSLITSVNNTCKNNNFCWLDNAGTSMQWARNPGSDYYIDGDITPAGAVSINYVPFNTIFQGGEFYPFGSQNTEDYHGTLSGAWSYSSGLSWSSCGNIYKTDYTGYVSDLVEAWAVGLKHEIADKIPSMLAELGFAYSTSQTAATQANIVTSPVIFVPVLDENGNPTDKLTNDPDKKAEYVNSGDELQPNFDPYDETPDYDPEAPLPEDPNTKTKEIELPEVRLTAAGVFNRSYALSITDMRNLANYLWNINAQTWDEIYENLKLVGNNRMDSIISAIMYPFEIPVTSDLQNIRIGREETTVTARPIASTNTIKFNLGKCYFYGKYKNFLDFEPYTQGYLYIPYCGIQKIPVNEFMYKWINVTMAVDLMTGAGQIVVYADGIPCIYKNCTVGFQIPVTGANSARAVANYIDLAQKAMSIPVQAGYNPGGAIMSAVTAQLDFFSLQNPPLESAGSSSPQTGLYMPQKCYFIVSRPKVFNVPYYAHLIGHSCYTGGLIGSFFGFSQFENIDLSIDTATYAEKEEIIKLLKSGVYL